VLPLLVFLGFQIAFLPFHDINITWAHRTYVIIDFLIIIILGIFISFPEKSFVSGFGGILVCRPFSSLVATAFGIMVLFFSLCVATIPEEPMDYAMAKLWSEAVPKTNGDQRSTRDVFKPTVFFFEGKIDRLTGRPSSWFSRNLVVTGNVLSKGKGMVQLTKRDLRHGVFDRTDMRNVDMRAVSAEGASFREANLANAFLNLANFQNANFWGAQLSGAKMRYAKLQHTSFMGANLNGVDLRGAMLDDADMGRTELSATKWADASMQNTNFADAQNLPKETLSEEQLAQGKF
jgi:hypothetical protein